MDLTTLRLEDLMNLDVTSVAKKPQKLSRAAGAIFIISREDIRRSGATNLPDLLRMVPGLEVAQINPSNWAISARGFNGQYSNKLLVLVDGRTVYNPVFAGVYWDEQDVALDLIERIEVIRGPGAAVWGVNAVNGIINILLKQAARTQGGLLALSTGSQEHIAGTVSYGGTVGRAGTYRIHADGFQIGSLPTADHQPDKDAWHRVSGDFRLDEDYSSQNSLSVESQATRGTEGGTVTTVLSVQPPLTGNVSLNAYFSDWNTTARWKHTTSAGSQTSLQTYFDRSSRNTGLFEGTLNTFDLEFQQQAQLLPHQEFVWGAGYRLNSDGLSDFWSISFSPAKLNTQIFSGFLQDEIPVSRRLSLSLGARLQHAYYNGYSLQPTAQLSWFAGERSMLWLQISRADRLPSRAETAIRWNLAAIPGPNSLPALISLFGNPRQKNEHLNGAEVGFRKDLFTFITIDATAFFNQYRDLSSIEAGTPRLETTPAPPHALYSYTFANGSHATTRGLELFGHLKVNKRWTLSPGYTFLSVRLPAAPLVANPGPALQQEGQDPRQQAQLRSFVTLASHWQWSSSAYFVGRLAASSVPSYTRLDTQLLYRANDRFSLMLVGQNLLKENHQEYGNSNLTLLPNLLRRSASFRLVWRLP